MEARRRSPPATTPDPYRRPDEDEPPPPIPDKMLDENDNTHTLSDGMLHNGQLPSPGSAVSECMNHVSSDSELSQLYSRVVKPVSLSLPLSLSDSEDKEGRLQQHRRPPVTSTTSTTFTTCPPTSPSATTSTPPSRTPTPRLRTPSWRAKTASAPTPGTRASGSPGAAPTNHSPAWSSATNQRLPLP
ncbi:mucin-2 [Sardina pilchardus]|uniref:mucin-2 n=1 Tax=Sardina pilchardus TaxID=27697 RepID=UPI002E0E75DE